MYNIQTYIICINDLDSNVNLLIYELILLHFIFLLKQFLFVNFLKQIFAFQYKMIHTGLKKKLLYNTI